jgi:2-oxoglutarate ferredoxin oxidoreductase subunit beta
VRSPCVTYGQEEQQIKAHRARMKAVAGLGHDPKNRMAAFELASHYAEELHTGVLYRNPEPPPTYGELIRARQQELAGKVSREKILEMFVQH